MSLSIIFLFASYLETTAYELSEFPGFSDLEMKSSPALFKLPNVVLLSFSVNPPIPDATLILILFRVESQMCGTG